MRVKIKDKKKKGGQYSLFPRLVRGKRSDCVYLLLGINEDNPALYDSCCLHDGHIGKICPSSFIPMDGKVVLENDK